MFNCRFSPVLRVVGSVLRDFCPADGKSVHVNGQNQNPLVCVISLQHHPIVTSSMRIDFLLSHARLEHQNINFYLRYRNIRKDCYIDQEGRLMIVNTVKILLIIIVPIP